MSDDARGSTVFVAGPPESGKSRLLWHCYARHAPRLITLEIVRETHKLAPNAVDAYGLDELYGRLNEYADVRRFPRWHIIAFLDDDENEQLFRKLCPRIKSRESNGYGRAVGGLALQCGELARIAPLGCSPAIRFAYLQYRHNWLSLYGGTQRPANVDPCVRTTNRCVFLRTSKDLDLKAVAQLTTPAIASLVRELPEHHSLTAIESMGKAYLADPAYRLYDVVDYRGVSLSRPANEVPRSRGEARSASGDVDGRHAAEHRQRSA